MNIPLGPDSTITVAANFEQMSQSAADFIWERAHQNPRMLICLATGHSPERTYELLAQKHRRNSRVLARLRVIKLDEWAGVPTNDPASCEGWLRPRVLTPWGITAERYCAWNSIAVRADEECQRIGDWLEKNGPIDLAVLGLGLNGHVGLNEPGDSLHHGPHLAMLSESTRNHAMLAALANKPKSGYTLGLSNLLQAKQLLVLVTGIAKSDVLKRWANTNITTRFPSSLLWLHPSLHLFCDQAAASELPELATGN